MLTKHGLDLIDSWRAELAADEHITGADRLALAAMLDPVPVAMDPPTVSYPMLTAAEARSLRDCIDNVQVSHLADPDWTDARSGLRKLSELASNLHDDAHRAVGGSE